MTTQATGGYVIHKVPLVRTGITKHTAALDRPVSQTDLDALNAVQATGWRINGFILDVMLEAYDKGLDIAGMALGKLPELPGRMDDAVWEAMDAKDRKAHTSRLADLHGQRATIEGRSQALLDKLTVANELRNHPTIWYPHTRDFRGRLYPIPVNGPHPQADGIGKALIMFAEGVPLGPDGLFWLCVRAANCAGHDKLPLVDRVAWTLAHREEIEVAADYPLGDGLAFWSGVDEDPWGFLATCNELAMIWEDPEGDPECFVSHLPVPMDGSCNGLQHLSAMGLDPVGAKATNLLPGDRQDIYMEVCKLICAQVEKDAAAGKREALAWLGKVNRSVCKRAVMTTPYGVTDRGIRTQLLNDGFVPGDRAEQGPAADYLRDCLVDALGQTIEAGRSIMAWIQTVASRLADAGIPLDWTTPTGSKCRQAYYVRVRKEVDTVAGKLIIEEEPEIATMLPRKQALGSAPNIVHSFDAAAMALTVLAASAEGIASFAMIHDSYGTHAGNATALARVLREQFVLIYKEDWLGRIYAEVLSYAPNVAIPPPPARGSLDIGQVLDSEFFFA